MSALLKITAVLILLCIALAINRCSTPSDSHYIESYLSNANIFASQEVTPVTINFVSMDKPREVLMQVALPRAYVVSFDPYQTVGSSPDHTVQKLPDILYGDGPLTLLYLHGPGTPLVTVASREIDKITGPEDSSFGKNYAVQPGSMKLRYLTGIAQLHFYSDQQVSRGDRKLRQTYPCVDTVLCSYRRGDEIGSYEGFKVYKPKPGSYHYYVDNGPDEIREIQCSGTLAQSRPQFYCYYRFPLNDHLFAELEFIDFRLHGGREFARQRIRAFKDKFCSYLHCDDRALAAAGLK
jgi:hypothetical protein